MLLSKQPNNRKELTVVGTLYLKVLFPDGTEADKTLCPFNDRRNRHIIAMTPAGHEELFMIGDWEFSPDENDTNCVGTVQLVHLAEWQAGENAAARKRANAKIFRACVFLGIAFIVYMIVTGHKINFPLG